MGTNINNKQSGNSSNEFQLKGAVKDKVVKDVSARMLQDSIDKYGDFCQVAKSLDIKDPIGETVKMILSDYGDRNILYDRRDRTSPMIINHSVEIRDNYYGECTYYSLFLTDQQISITVLSFLAAIAKGNGELPKGFEKTGLLRGDKKDDCYDKIIEYIKRLCYAYIYRVKAH